MKECWIPALIEYDSSKTWAEYDMLLYSIFKADFIFDHPLYKGQEVKVRFNPRFEEREEAFWHLTCADFDHKSGQPQDRETDLERCKRIRWPKSFIENHMKCVCSAADTCRGVLVWEVSHKSKKGARKRIKLFLEEECYLVVLEPRRNYCLLITAYYVDKDYSYKSIMRDARRHNAKIAGSAD